MDSIFRGDLASRRGRANAWLDSLLVDHGLLRLGWGNFGTVVPGRLYRSNHPTPARLAAYARRYGLRSVVNLRGACSNGSDALSREAAARLGLQLIDVPLRSRAAPSREALLALAETLLRTEVPALVHCKSGADRSGFAAGVYLLVAEEGRTAAEALAQMSARFGHLGASGAGILGDVFRLYARQAEGRRPFLDWVREEYDPAALRPATAGRRRWSRLAAWLNDRVLARE